MGGTAFSLPAKLPNIRFDQPGVVPVPELLPEQIRFVPLGLFAASAQAVRRMVQIEPEIVLADFIVPVPEFPVARPHHIQLLPAAAGAGFDFFVIGHDYEKSLNNANNNK